MLGRVGGIQYQRSEPELCTFGDKAQVLYDCTMEASTQPKLQFPVKRIQHSLVHQVYQCIFTYVTTGWCFPGKKRDGTYSLYYSQLENVLKHEKNTCLCPAQFNEGGPISGYIY